MNKCLSCDRNKDNDAGLCKDLGSDNLPVMCVGDWVEDKYYYVDHYCRILSVGMSKKWKHRYYIDLFSGPGIGLNRATGNEVKGSPLIALSHKFTDYIFIDSNSKSLDALKIRSVLEKQNRNIKFILGDSNDVIDEIIKGVEHKDSLCLVFADPFTIQLKMRTLQSISNKLRADLLIHFPYGTYLRRVLTQENISKAKAFDIDNFYGNTKWRSLLTESPNVLSYLELYEEELGAIGYQVSSNYPCMKNSKKAVLYYLIFASRNTKALEFWEKVCAIDATGQRKLF